MKPETLDHLLNHIQEKYDAEWTSHYGEPGYTADKGIILANWNNVPKNIATTLEGEGYSLEWSDEWMIDYNNSKAYRTSPDSYHWQCQVRITRDGEWLTPDDGIEAWLEELAATDPAHKPDVLPGHFTEQELEAAGYRLISDNQENGFHPGQTDTPEPVQKQAFDEGATHVIFRLTEASQFYIVYQAWAKFLEEE